MLRMAVAPLFVTLHRGVSLLSEPSCAHLVLGAAASPPVMVTRIRLMSTSPRGIFAWPSCAFRPCGGNGAPLAGLPGTFPGGQASAYGSDALRRRRGISRRSAQCLPFLHPFRMVAEGPGKMCIAGGELLAGAVQRRSPSRPRRRSSPSNLCSARAAVGASVILLSLLGLHVHGRSRGHKVRQV